MEDDDETYVFTQKGLFFAMEVHHKLLDGWTLEQVAKFYELEPMLIQVLLVAFYDAAEKNGVDLGIYVPDTIEGLDG
jgi:hypothetical protein